MSDQCGGVCPVCCTKLPNGVYGCMSESGLKCELTANSQFGILLTTLLIILAFAIGINFFF